MGPPKRPRVSREGMSGQGSNKTLFTEASRVWPAAVPLCQPGPQGCGARAPRLGDADLELSQGKQLAKAWGPDRICEIALAGRVGAWGGWERSRALLECCQPISTRAGSRRAGSRGLFLRCFTAQVSIYAFNLASRRETIQVNINVWNKYLEVQQSPP